METANPKIVGRYDGLSIFVPGDRWPRPPVCVAKELDVVCFVHYNVFGRFGDQGRNWNTMHNFNQELVNLLFLFIYMEKHFMKRWWIKDYPIG